MKGSEFEIREVSSKREVTLRGGGWVNPDLGGEFYNLPHCKEVGPGQTPRVDLLFRCPDL